MATEYLTRGKPLPSQAIPDNLTIPQFILDGNHPVRPLKNTLTPCLVEDATGRLVGYEEVRSPACSACIAYTIWQIRARTFGLANELKARWNICESDLPNHP